MSDALALEDCGVAELLRLFRGREASPVEAVEACLSQIEALDAQINAVLTLCPEQALADAKRATAAYMNDERPATLAGIPFGLKDVIATKDVRTTGGSRLFDDYLPTADATVARRLRKAGAVLVAKLNTMEFNTGEEWNENFGPVRNPWDLSCYTGGSSSGSAGAVSARMLPVALGADTGGSVRIPCANTGLAGIRPTLGRVSSFGVMPLSWSLDQVGPMARTVTDVALALQVIAGHDRLDPRTSAKPVPDYSRDLDAGIAGLRLGVPERWFFEDLDPEVEQLVRNALGELRGLGAELVEIDLPLFEMTTAVAWIVLGAEFASLQETNRRRQVEGYGEVTATRLSLGEFWSSQDYLRAQRVRHLMQRQCEEAFKRVDAIVTPATSTVAARFVGREPMVSVGGELRPWVEAALRQTQPFSLTGMPCAVVPCGFDEQGLPAGLQVAAPPHADALALRVARAYERCAPWGDRRPPLTAAPEA